jgi:amidase
MISARLLRRIIWVGLAAACAARVAALDLGTATIPQLQAALAEGSLTSEKLTAAYLARIAAYDKQGPAINSIILLNPEGTRGRAGPRCRAQGRPGPRPAARHPHRAEG